jgi:IS30 family transposase
MKHLTAEQRYAISLLLQQGKTQKEIAQIIGKHKSTVSREIARNQDKRSGKYNYELAERKYRQRIREKPKKIHFTQAVKDFVESQLKEDLSPEQIVGVAKKEGIACVSHERIYQHVWEDKKKGGRLYMHLRTQGKRYRKRGQKKDQRGIIPNRVDIDKRPKIVEEKTRVGDFEVDTIIGKNHQGALVTINDRKTGLVKIRKVNSKNAEQVAQAVIDALTPYKPFLHTITSDNGKEFALHAKISQHLGVEFFFAKPYHSWQRGANENLNGLIRQYFPKKTDFSTITDHQVQMVEEKLNNRPRKRFNFESPLYMFNLLTNSSKVAFVT